MSYTWWLDAHILGSKMFFNFMKGQNGTVAELNEWMAEDRTNWRFVKRDITEKNNFSSRSGCNIQGGVRFVLWSEAVKFKMIFAEIIVEGDESEEFDPI